MKRLLTCLFLVLGLGGPGGEGGRVRGGSSLNAQKQYINTSLGLIDGRTLGEASRRIDPFDGITDARPPTKQRISICVLFRFQYC